MNRDDSRLIKIPDANAVAAITGEGGGAVGQQQNSAASIAPVFPQRPSVIEMPVGSSLGGSGSGPQQAHRTGVTVYRGEPTGVGPSTLPPAAHTGVVLTASPSPGAASQPPSVVMHVPQPTVVSQLPSAIKPEPISLPTAPVSIQYANTFHGGGPLSNSGPPAAVKTLANSLPVTMSQSVQSIVNNLQQQHQQQQQQQQVATTVHQVVHNTPKPPNHQSANFSSTTAFRTITSAPNSGAAPIASSVGNMNNSGIGIASGGANANSANFQRLKVEDALSYLDQVKYKFGNQPQVYNDFLDIMKEFKSQSIDTPGVIARVSSLFRGHPELIVGFNTFLPPGYKIEVHSNDSIGVNMPGSMGATVQTIVHTPHGIHKMTTHGSGPLTSITTSNTGQVQPMQQQHLPQAPPPPQQQGNIIRMHLGTPSTTFTALNTPKFLPQSQQQQQHGVKIESLSTNNLSGNYHPGLVLGGAHLPTTPLLHTSTTPSQIPNAAAQAVAQVRQQMQQQQLQQQQQQLSSGLVAVSAMGSTPGPAGSTGGAQPVEFNHAINYVNKIKNRFQGQPDVYKQFLEILHTYQKDQKAIKEGHQPTGPYLTEAEVYAQVAKLFQNQEDLLAEFGQFLPEATGENSMMNKGLTNDHASVTKKPVPVENNFKLGAPKFGAISGAQTSGPLGPIIGSSSTSMKRPPSGVAHPPPKKQKTGVLRDVSLAEAGKYGTLNEYAFFDKVRKALRSPEVYDNFLRCLVLFNQEVISRAELVQITTPFLGRHPELFKWFKDFVGYREGGINIPTTPHGSRPSTELESHQGGSVGRTVEENRVLIESERGARERISAESAMEIDYATCKRLGASYCALPKNFVLPSCSGRTALCKEVLNDTWVSFPSWSEDSTFVTSRKTQYEEAIYRTEDERFEFDVVLETNKDTIKVLECVQKKMSRMPPEEAARYRLDDCLGGTSSTVHQKAIRRIYGDKAADIVEGLKRNPVVAVPLVLRRLRAKDEEWREVQKTFNKIWRDQNEKYYLKSLDHQSLMFKQSDIRNLRSKSLLNEIETLYDERHEQSEYNDNGGTNSATGAAQEGPHLSLTYQGFSVLDDANNLLIHHVKRQTFIHKEDKQKIKVLLKHFLMDRYKHPRQDLSDDEREEDDDSGKDDGEGDSESGNGAGTSGSKSTRSERARKKQSKEESSKNSGPTSSSNNNSKNGAINTSDNSDSGKNKDIGKSDIKIEPKDGRRTPLHARDMEPDESYTLLMANNNWYLFLRLHHILCERLTKMFNQAVVVASEETKDKKDRKESTAVALRLKPQNEVEPEDYYPAFLDMVKNLLDGNMDSQAYEDTLREMFGIHAYVSFTLDKVVGNAVRQLQHLVTDEVCLECYDLFLSESKMNGTGGNCGSAAERQIPELIYLKKAEKLLTDENCMKIILYHQSGSMTIELLDTETDGQESDKEEETTRKYQSYLDAFIGPGDEISDECQSHLISKPVFLPRSIRSFNKRSRARQTKRENSSPDETNTTSTENNSVSIHNTRSNEANVSESERVPIKTEDDVVYEDNTQCHFNLKNFKILYIINSENCFYRRFALRRAITSHKTVSLQKSSAFSFWHASWVRQNVPDAAHHSMEQWFMGKSDQLVPNRTQKLSRSSQEKAPYRQYHRYRVDLPKIIPDSIVPAAGVTSFTNML